MRFTSFHYDHKLQKIYIRKIRLHFFAVKLDRNGDFSSKGSLLKEILNKKSFFHIINSENAKPTKWSNVADELFFSRA